MTEPRMQTVFLESWIPSRECGGGGGGQEKIQKMTLKHLSIPESTKAVKAYRDKWDNLSATRGKH